MLNYLIRRILYALPILLGVNTITFLLFFTVNSPDDIARAHLGSKYITTAQITEWKQEHNYNKPLFFNSSQQGLNKINDTLFFNKSVSLFMFNFGSSEQGRDIGFDIKQRMWPSLALAIPTLLIGLFIDITFAMFMAFFRGTYLDVSSVVLCIILMSISSMFYIIGGQFLLGKILQVLPISGYEGGLSAFRFLILPVIVGVISGIGSSARWYRTIFLEEMHKDYVRTARAKGLSELIVLFKHVLKNAMIPIITTVVTILPLLFMGSLIMESFFGIPGLGSYTIEAIQQQDFEIVRVMVFLGTVFYILGLMLTDICYTLVDPRVRFN